MKESELRNLANCAICGKGIGHDQDITFYKVNIERYMMDIGAVKRQSGLAMAMGSAFLASFMGPDEDMADKIQEKTISICEPCALDKTLSVAFALGEEEDE